MLATLLLLRGWDDCDFQSGLMEVIVFLKMLSLFPLCSLHGTMEVPLS